MTDASTTAHGPTHGQTTATTPDLWADSGFATRAIHAGQDPDPTTGAVVPPVYLTSTYKQDGVGGLRNGYEYSRSGNPTRTALETALAAAEAPGDGSTPVGLAFASGLAAEDAILRAVLRPGDHIILPDDAYGGSFRLIARTFGQWGVDHSPVDLTHVDAVRAAIQPGRTRIIWAETPTNPLLTISNIAVIADVAHQAGAILVVDNTFATPYLQTPLALGADVVVHSTTKYVGGHSDVVGGALVIAADAVIPGERTAPDGVTGSLAEAARFHQNASGGAADPFAAWLTLRGLKTLAVRMDRHQANAQAVAEYLEAHPAVTRVLYPGLPSHPQHALAAQQMRGFGGMVSFQTGSQASALTVVDRTRVFTLAESLGGVESLIEHPGKMTHGSVTGTALEVPADLVRVSVGIESIDDLIADLDQALSGL